ncbi:MAG: branched-chain amino acid ABC transporter permease [Mycobacterium leprae]
MAAILNNYYLQILTLICLHGLLGLSVYLVYSTGQLTLGNAGFMAIGAYAAALLALRGGLPVWLSIPAGALLAALVAVPLGYAGLRLRGVYLAVATLGFSQSVMVVAQNLTITGGAMGLNNIPNINMMVQKAFSHAMDEAPMGLKFSQLASLTVFLLMLLILLLAFFFVLRQGRSRVGQAFAAIRTDEVAAGAMGINTTYYKVLAFAQGAFLAGLAGGLSAHTTFAIAPGNFDFNRAVEMLTYVVVGGSGLPLGAVFGAVVLDVISEGLRDVTLFGVSMTEYRFILFGLLMMLVMALRPQGLLSRRRRKGVAA